MSERTIESVTAVPVLGGFFFDDQRAIKEGAPRDGFGYGGEPSTPGFDRVREPSEAVSVLVELADGRTAIGDCAAVQYSGTGGRDPLFRAEQYAPVVESVVADELVGRDAAATATNRTMAGVVADAYDTAPATEPVPVYAQTGDARRENAEKMLLKGVDVLPHGLFNSVEKIGEDGEELVAYLEWLADRAADLGPPDYEPTFHVDVYGAVGDVFGPPYDRAEVVDYFADLRAAAAPYPLQVEGPMDAGSRQAQMDEMAELRAGLADADVAVDIVADEWCNTLEDVKAFVDGGATDLVQVKTPDLGGLGRSVEAVDYCAGTDTRAYLGGTCAETDLTARACANVAVATDPAQVLAKPGMGVDTGVMIVENEMRRALTRMR